MKIQAITVTAVAMVLSSFTLTAQANDANANNTGTNTGHNWMPPQVQNNYWQAPDWSNFNFSPSAQPPRPNYAPPPAGYQQPNYQQPNHQQQMAPPPRPAPNYRQPHPAYNQQQNMNRARPNMAPPPNAYRGNPPPPRGPYGPDNGASAFNVPGYHRNRNNNGWSNWGNNGNNGWDNNKFWGRSGPSRWMNPNKRNMEDGWDDMINAPSRMGEMPGGWTAPEVSMPNPIDMGDQMQDNIKDLPEQIRDMDVGN